MSNEQEIECTWLELLRDQWPHTYGFILLPVNSYFHEPPVDEFYDIMGNIRGYRKSGTFEQAKARAKQWATDATKQLEAEIALACPALT